MRNPLGPSTPVVRAAKPTRNSSITHRQGCSLPPSVLMSGEADRWLGRVPRVLPSQREAPTHRALPQTGLTLIHPDPDPGLRQTRPRAAPNQTQGRQTRPRAARQAPGRARPDPAPRQTRPRAARQAPGRARPDPGPRQTRPRFKCDQMANENGSSALPPTWIGRFDLGGGGGLEEGNK